VGEADIEVAAHRGFAEFYAAVWPDLAGYAGSLVPDGTELAQEALTRVYVRWGLLREPRPYAFRIVTNLARDAWSSGQREAQVWAGVNPPPRADPDHELIDAVRRLRPSHRDVLLLHYWADLSVADVARVLRRPAGTVKRRLHEARAELARQWEETS
jgi:RNA polymerase sigma-70 factor (ECF subfamily)